MGTTWSVRLTDANLGHKELRQLQAEIEARLADINREMSTYDPESEISRFNRAGALEPVVISIGFQQVVRRALELSEATGGAFDPTVGALVNLWSFGPVHPDRRTPTPEQIAAARETVGWWHLALTPDGTLTKDIPDLFLDLGAIAKGHGVDRVAALLRERNLKDFLVEIGGETLAAGHNADGVPWRVGVLRPDFAAENDLQGVIHLTGGRAVATSGDYENYYRDEHGNVRSHIIDPRTAEPVPHAVASVSVLAGDCRTADALATALTVLGPNAGLRLLAARFPGVEALFIMRRRGNQYQEILSPGFADILDYEH